MKYSIFNIALLVIMLCHTINSSAELTKFRNLTMADGLSMSVVYCIEQDQYGFIWIGTRNGLDIYDGTRFKHYLSKNIKNNIITNKTVHDIVINGDSAWIATFNELLLMNVRSKSYQTISIGDTYYIRTLLLDKKDQVLWIGTNTGLVKYFINTGDYIHYNTSNSNISHNIVRALYKGNDGVLWIGTYNKISKLAPNSSVFEVLDVCPKCDKVDNQLILSIKPLNSSNDSILLIGTQKSGLLVLNQKTNQKTFFDQNNTKLINNVIKTINVSSNGSIWLGTDFGLVKLNKQFDSNIYLHNPLIENSLVNNVVWDIFEDNSGAIWCATNNGLSVVVNLKERFHFHPIIIRKQGNLAGCEIRAITNFKDDNLLLSTQNGLILYNVNTRTQTQLSMSSNDLTNDVGNCLVDKSGRIWIATAGGISLIDSNGKRRKFLSTSEEKNGLRTNYIYNFFELEDGTILIDTHKGVHKVIESNNTMHFDFIGDFHILSISDGILWSSNESTLIRVNAKTFEKLPEVSFKVNGYDISIESLLVSEKNKVWIGYENGLIEFDNISGKYIHYEIKSNKHYALISLLEDNEGNIWASSYSSIIKFSIDSKEFEIFSATNEIVINRFLEGACSKTQTGDLIFGGHNGFIQFSPVDITKSNFFPPTRLTKLSIMNTEVTPETLFNGRILLNEELPFTNQLILDYTNNSFSIEFSTLTYGIRDGLKYSYFLEGIDDTWRIDVNHIGRAFYSSIPAGNYTFYVRGTNRDGVWNTDVSSLKIAVKPPLWASKSFIIAYVVFISLLLTFIISYFINNIRFKNRMKILNIEKEHAKNLAIKRQQFLTNIAHEFRTPLSLIVGPLEKLNNSIALDKKNQKYLNLIRNNTRRLLWLSNQLLEFRKIERDTIELIISEFEVVGFSNSVFMLFKDFAEDKNINYIFTSEIPELKAYFDIRKLETILYNLLSNAFKFTPENGEIKLSINTISYQNNIALQFEISDTGIGIPEKDLKHIFKRFYQSDAGIKMERGSGIGLTLVDEYVKIHNGEIDVTSSLGKGSTFRITLPLKQKSDFEDQHFVPQHEVPRILVQSNKPEFSMQPDLSLLNSGQYILLIEDDKEFADYLCMSLREKYTVFWVQNGKEALITVSKKTPMLVISDVTMPEMSGYEFTRKFKSNQKTAHIAVILISSHNLDENQLEGFKSGADDYLIKPFVIEMLELKIANSLKHDKQIVANLEITELSKPSDKEITTQDEKLLKKVKEILEKYISNPALDINKLCVETGLSYSFLYRKIKKITGQSINEFIRTLRIRRAGQLLSDKKVSVADAMHETGFSSHSYFSKCFRKVYNMTPKEFLNRNQ